MLLKRFFTICIAASLLMGSLLLEKIAKAAEDEDTTQKNHLESSDMGPMNSGADQGGGGGDRSAGASDSDSPRESASEPTSEQMKKRQQIIVY
ncbi:MAG: hypothetical protein ACOCWR_03745 [Oceanidesulfovibrio sp.]